MQGKPHLPWRIIQCYPHSAIPRQVAPQQSLSTLHRTPYAKAMLDGPGLSLPKSESQRSSTDSPNKHLASKGSFFLSMVQATTSILAANFTRALVLIPLSP